MASIEGTKKYKDRFTNLSDDFFSSVDELFLSSVGMGSFAPENYKEENYIYSFKDAVMEGVKLGCNVIDTAINYRCQMSEREIGEALKELEKDGYSRDELFITTKAGFIPLDFPFPQNPYIWIQDEIVNKDLAKKDEVIEDQHCLSPKYIEWSLEQSLKNLGVGKVDVLFIHNPEMQQLEIGKEAMKKRLHEAFQKCEELCDSGKIGAYGVASWNGFLYEEENAEYLSMLEIVNIAKNVKETDNRLKFVQFPYNLAKPHAYNYANQLLEDGLYYSPFQAAKKLGLHTMTSSTFLRMNLFKSKFSEKIRWLLSEDVPMSDIQRALNFARSNGYSFTSLFSTKDIEHLRHNMEIAGFSRAKIQNYNQIFRL